MLKTKLNKLPQNIESAIWALKETTSSLVSNLCIAYGGEAYHPFLVGYERRPINNIISDESTSEMCAKAIDAAENIDIMFYNEGVCHSIYELFDEMLRLHSILMLLKVHLRWKVVPDDKLCQRLNPDEYYIFKYEKEWVIRTCEEFKAPVHELARVKGLMNNLKTILEK